MENISDTNTQLTKKEDEDATQETLTLELQHKAKLIRQYAQIGYTDEQFAYLLKQQLDDLMLALKEWGGKG